MRKIGDTTEKMDKECVKRRGKKKCTKIKKKRKNRHSHK